MKLWFLEQKARQMELDIHKLTQTYSLLDTILFIVLNSINQHVIEKEEKRKPTGNQGMADTASSITTNIHSPGDELL